MYFGELGQYGVFRERALGEFDRIGAGCHFFLENLETWVSRELKGGCEKVDMKAKSHKMCLVCIFQVDMKVISLPTVASTISAHQGLSPFFVNWDNVCCGL